MVVRSVYNGGPANVVDGRERSCLFHWEQSLHLHIQMSVWPRTFKMNINICGRCGIVPPWKTRQQHCLEKFEDGRQ